MSTKKTSTDDLAYEVVVVAKNGLSRRDGLLYRGIRCARREAERLRKMGEQPTILPYRPIDEPQYMRLAVA